MFKSKKFNADYVVTGHFAQIKKSQGKYYMYRAKDETKDQSYFLYRLREKDLKKILFPIGDYTKEQVRKIAKENGFINHEKKSTVGICFIGKTTGVMYIQKVAASVMPLPISKYNVPNGAKKRPSDIPARTSTITLINVKKTLEKNI